MQNKRDESLCLCLHIDLSIKTFRLEYDRTVFASECRYEFPMIWIMVYFFTSPFRGHLGKMRFSREGKVLLKKILGEVSSFES